MFLEKVNNVFEDIEFKDSTGKDNILPVTFHRFLTIQEPPFLVWWKDESEDLQADNVNYLEISNIQVELYMDPYDEDLVNSIQKRFKDNNIIYKRTKEIYIDEERLFLVGWSFYFI